MKNTITQTELVKLVMDRINTEVPDARGVKADIRPLPGQSPNWWMPGFSSYNGMGGKEASAIVADFQAKYDLI